MKIHQHIFIFAIAASLSGCGIKSPISDIQSKFSALTRKASNVVDASKVSDATKSIELVELIKARGELGDLAQWAQGEVRGEITVVVDGASSDDLREAAGLADDESVARAVAEAMKCGMSRKDAAAQVAEAAGLSKRYVYDASLRTRADS